MDGFRVSMDEQPAAEDVAFLEGQINAYNIAATGHDDGRELALFLRDAAGVIAGGLYGWTWGGHLEVRYLWLRADLRGQGHGSALLRAAEEEAVRRGCGRVLLDSYSFQAPAFYRRHGYEEFGVLEDVPVGFRRHYFWKVLGRSD